MKGIVFTEWMEMVEQDYGLATLDAVINDAQLPHGGVYTAVGTYPHQEMVALVVALSHKTGTAIPDLLRHFGRHLFKRFAAGYGVFFEGVDNAYTFLGNIENYIHIEVRKLYPDVELPTFDCQLLDGGRMVLIYRSQRHFADLAHGLIEGCIEYFGEQIALSRDEMTPEGEGQAVAFRLQRQGSQV